MNNTSKKIIVMSMMVIAIIAIVFVPKKIASSSEQSQVDPDLETPLIGEARYKEMIILKAMEYGLPEAKIAEIQGVIGGVPGTECPNGESTWNADAVGDGGTSLGLVQIHIPAHPHITPEQAKNPEFAIEFIVKEFKAGNESKWTCWRKIYG